MDPHEAETLPKAAAEEEEQEEEEEAEELPLEEPHGSPRKPEASAEAPPAPLPAGPSSGKAEDEHGGAAANIRVAVRIRPFGEGEREQASGGTQVLEAINGQEILVHPLAGYLKQDRTFGYDHVLSSMDENSPAYASQAQVFQLVGAPIVENAFNGFNGCLLAYGQTGSGKSYSVLGGAAGGEERGVLPRACENVFEQIARRRLEAEEQGLTLQAAVLVSYLEIYQEKIHDLLASSQTDLQVRIHPVLGAHVPSLTQSPVTSMNQVQELLDFGSSNRAVAATLMNSQSSRSHAVFALDLRLSLSGKAQQSKIHFVDLAGSEKQKRTDAEGRRLTEGIAINQSLGILSRCIMALSAASNGGRRKSVAVTQAPFRESKLTLLLKDALSGNSKTALIACVSPSAVNLEESLSTLDFASRCKLVKTSAKRNDQSKADLVESLAVEKRIVEEQLQYQLEQQRALQERLDQEVQQSRESQELALALERETRALELQLRALELSARAAAREEALAAGAEGAQGGRQRRSADAETEGSGGLDEGDEDLQRAQERRQAMLQDLQEDQERWQAERRHELQRQRELAREVELRRQEVEAAERGRREVLEQLEQAHKQQDRSAEEWAKVQSQSRHRAEELEELLRHQEDDHEERDRLGDELREVQDELQRAQEARTQSQEEARRGRLELEDRLRRLEADRAQAEAQVRELRWAQGDEQQRWEALLAEKETQAAKLQEAREVAAEHAAREYAQVVERLQHEKTEELLKVEEEHSKVVAQLQTRITEMEGVEWTVRKTVTEALLREQELRKQVESDMQRHEARAEELSHELKGLQGQSHSWEAQRLDLEARAQQQTRDRERIFEELGIAGVDMGATETRHMPRLVNLHQDPMLEGCMVYYLRQGETPVGSDPGGVRLPGLGAVGEVCTITNQDDRRLIVRAVQDELVRLNGAPVSGEGQELREGDRLAVGRLHLFRAVVPLARGRRPSQLEAGEREFDLAMSERGPRAGVAPRWRPRVEAAALAAKAEFGTKEACELLRRARAASDAIGEADALIRSALAACPVEPPDTYAPVHELVVLFEADAPPRLCVVCRCAGLDEALAAALPGGAAGARARAATADGGGPGGGLLRACSAGLWEASRFEAERLPRLREVASAAAAAAATTAAPRPPPPAAAEAPAVAPSPAEEGRRRSRRSRQEEGELSFWEELLWFFRSDRRREQSSFWCCGSSRPGRGA